MRCSSSSTSSGLRATVGSPSTESTVSPAEALSSTLRSRPCAFTALTRVGSSSADSSTSATSTASSSTETTSVCSASTSELSSSSTFGSSRTRYWCSSGSGFSSLTTAITGIEEVIGLFTAEGLVASTRFCAISSGRRTRRLLVRGAGSCSFSSSFASVSILP